MVATILVTAMIGPPLLFLRQVSLAGAQDIAAGSRISIIGPIAPTGGALGADSLPLPKMLDGYSVLLNGSPIPLAAIDVASIEAQVPFEIKPGPALMELRDAAGTIIAATKVTVVSASITVFASNPVNAAHR